MADTITVTETSYTLTVTPAATQTVTVSTDDQTLTINETAGTTVTVTQPASQTVTVSTSQGIGNYTTDDLAEGSTNLYHTTARASAAAPVQSLTMPTGYTVGDVSGDLTVSVQNGATIRSEIGADNAANLTGNIAAARVATIPINSFSDVSITKTADNIVYTDGANVRARAASNWNLSEFTNDLVLSSTDYVSHPVDTSWKFFCDFFQVTPDLGSNDGNNQFWMMGGGSGISPQDQVSSSARGQAQHTAGGANRRYAYWGAMILNDDNRADGDELLWEARVYFTDSTATTGSVSLGVVDRVNTLNRNDSPPSDGYSAFDFASIVFNLANTNVVIADKDTGSAGTPTSTDLGGSFPMTSYVDTWFRVGVHCKFNNTDSDWDIDFYINGTKVGSTTSMTFDECIVPFVGIGVGTHTGNCGLNIDWISYQGNIGQAISGRTTALNIGSL